MNTDIRKILIAFDFSNISKHALEQGCALAEIFSAQMDVLYVLDNTLPGYFDQEDVIPSVSTNLKKRVTKEITRVVTPPKNDNLQWQSLVKTGKPYQVITEHAKNEKMDLIILGTHGYTGFERMLLGSVSEKVLRHAPCPVLIHRHTDTKGFRKILVPVDLSDGSKDIVQYAAQFAQGCSAEIEIFHALPISNLMNISDLGPSLYPQVEIGRITKSLEERFDTFTEKVKADIPELQNLNLNFNRKVGPPVPTILDVRESGKRDIIIMGSHEGKLTKMLLGSVAENISRYAKCSVLVIREKSHS